MHVWGPDVAAFVGAPWCVVVRLVSKAWRMHIPNLPMKPGVGPLKMTNVRLGKDTSVFIIENYADDISFDCAWVPNTRVVGKGFRTVVRNRDRQDVQYVRGRIPFQDGILSAEITNFSFGHDKLSVLVSEKNRGVPGGWRQVWLEYYDT